MNHTQASCGHNVVAVGAPGSAARMEVEGKPCERCGGKFRVVAICRRSRLAVEMSGGNPWLIEVFDEESEHDCVRRLAYLRRLMPVTNFRFFMVDASEDLNESVEKIKREEVWND